MIEEVLIMLHLAFEVIKIGKLESETDDLQIIELRQPKSDFTTHIMLASSVLFMLSGVLDLATGILSCIQS